MKRTILLFILILLLFLPLGVLASIDHNLYYGLTSNVEVKEMQQFLTSKGLYTGRDTGNFFSLTLSAVKKYQKSIGLNGTGFVGSLTKASINRELAGNPITPTLTPTVSITYPTIGLTLKKEKTYTITWTSKNLPALLTGTIRLYPNDFNPLGSISAATTIANNVSLATGQFSWTIPNNTVYDGEFNVTISYNIGDKFYFASSDPFNIKSQEPTITITSPVLGSDLVKGRTYTISWTSEDIPTSSVATVSLYPITSGAQPIAIIANNILVSTGKVSWVADVSTGQYKISILSSNGSRDDSGIFNILSPQPKITVIYPAADVILTKGQTYEINWTYQDMLPSTSIIVYLCRYTGNIVSTLSNIVSAVPNNPVVSAGKVSWTLPNTQNIFASRYIIYIVTDDGAIKAWSNVFNIRTATSPY